MREERLGWRKIPKCDFRQLQRVHAKSSQQIAGDSRAENAHFLEHFHVVRRRQQPTLLFAGEGQDLARRLAAASVPIGYDESLRVYHRNRERLADLVRQKYAHGRGRAQLLRKTGDLDLRRYAARYAVRHFAEPMASMLTRRLRPSDALYRVATNAVFWAGTLREVARGDDA
jgi:hypothetical protein